MLGSLETTKGKLLELACSLQSQRLQCLWTAGLKMHPSPILCQVGKTAQTDHEAIKSCHHLSCASLENQGGDTHVSGMLSLPRVGTVTKH